MNYCCVQGGEDGVLDISLSEEDQRRYETQDSICTLRNVKVIVVCVAVVFEHQRRSWSYKCKAVRDGSTRRDALTYKDSRDS